MKSAILCVVAFLLLASFASSVNLSGVAKWKSSEVSARSVVQFDSSDLKDLLSLSFSAFTADIIDSLVPNFKILASVSASASANLQNTTASATVDLLVWIGAIPGSNDLLNNLQTFFKIGMLPSSAFLYFSATPSGTLNNWKLADLNVKAEAIGIGAAYSKIIEYEDVNSNSVFDEKVDKTISTYELSSKGWNAFTESTTPISGGDGNVYQFSASTEDGVFSISYTLTADSIIASDLKLTPGSSGVSITVNYPYVSNTSSLSIKTFVGSASADALAKGSASFNGLDSIQASVSSSNLTAFTQWEATSSSGDGKAIANATGLASASTGDFGLLGSLALKSKAKASVVYYNIGRPPVSSSWESVIAVGRQFNAFDGSSANGVLPSFGTVVVISFVSLFLSLSKLF